MSTLSSPRLSTSFTASLSGGSAPATTASSINHASTSAPSVGTGAGNTDKVYSSTFAITSSTASTTLDVRALTDPLGATMSLLHVTGILVTNDSTTSAEIITLAGGTTSALFTDQITIQANGGAGMIQAPNPGIASATNAKNLVLSVASGTNVAGKITIMGRSA